MNIKKALFLSIALLSTVGLLNAKKIEPQSLQEQTIQVLAKKIVAGDIDLLDAKKALPQELWEKLYEAVETLTEPHRDLPEVMQYKTLFDESGERLGK